MDEQYDDDQEDGWTEDTTNNALPVGCLDTLLIPVVPQEEHHRFSFAPGEGNKPPGQIFRRIVISDHILW